ncbi:MULTISPECIES: insulinase family protein [unclassified Granulicatella]|uniref:insulinase family protein n=1 Tax=unclassified Granulicatella TaxID=2630493 RepID=UPI0010745ACA|nr:MULTISPECIES: insulinase family protein [unclassified Granulicatella]MBF0780837.1 insulinase family protein [Granulicatella sp. 19428wC4_WM01]TFU93523.1 hypothetical protein E4T68_06965 [Granulicatella sp. WM01]
MTFTLQQTINLPDINSIGYVYEHQKTKAKVFHIANDDSNKTFSIAFATPPYNDNGIAHILEHSVLCGSRKYPTKEPFVELMKSSLNTFLNAMTFSDKTIYPVASQNDKDFYHLMDVYLDAVFFPNLLTNTNILKQEGWHYHLEHADEELSYTGVVYNEMKGVFSDPNQVIQRAIQSALFPDTIYAHESGGDPVAIPQLTQEEFVHFHQTYYHPSNSYTVLYGNMAIEDKLGHLDEYFDLFDYRQINSLISEQMPFKESKTLNLSYSITEEESNENKTFIGLDFVIGKSTDVALNIQFSILSDILLGSEVSPLRQALMASNITSDVSGYFDSFAAQSVFNVLIKNSQDKHVETFKSIVLNTLHQLVQEGINSKLITAAINKAKFNLKEAEQGGTPKGVSFAILTTDMALYNGEAFGNLQFEKHIRYIEEHPERFVELIRHYLLDNPHMLLTIASPEYNLNDRTFEQIHHSLQNYKATLSQKEIDHLVQQTHDLIAYQNQPDSPEALACIPTLSLDDLNPKAKELELVVEHVNDVTYLHHPSFTSGIDYISFHFDLSHLTLDELQYASLMSRLLGNLSTTHYSLEDLVTEIDSHTGGISFATSVFNESTKDQRFVPNFIVKGKSFTDKVDTLLHLIQNILQHTQFQQKDKLREHIHKIKSHLENHFIFQGHLVALSRLRTYYAKSAKLDDYLNGISFYQFICTLAQEFDERYIQISQMLECVFAKTFIQNNLIVGFIGVQQDYINKKNTIHQFVTAFNHITLTAQSLDLPVAIQNEGWAFASDVQYVAQGFNISLDGLSYTSQLFVLKNILSLHYLWNKVRVQGGAYGAFTLITRDGDISFISYRDPHTTNTIEIYEQASQFIDDLQLNTQELTKAIIGTIGEIDAPRSPKLYGEAAFLRYRLGITFDMVQQERTQILQTTLHDLKQLSSFIQTAMNHHARCIVGNKKSLEQTGNLLHNIQTLIQ